MENRNKTKILLVGQGLSFGKELKEYLLYKDFDVTFAKDGMEGFDRFKKDSIDVCIIDVTMPYRDGYTLAREIRGRNSEIPIIFVTGKSMKEEALKGYKAGARDFLNKSADPKVILTRIETVIQRKAEIKADDMRSDFQIGGFHFNSRLRLLTVGGDAPRKLSKKENELLKILALHENELMPRELALSKIWRDNSYFSSRSMDVYISKLRKYLKADGDIEIVNIPKEGFRLVVKNKVTVQK